MKLKEYKNIYFVGIGGIGMSALARYFNNKRVNIFGYDRVKSSLCVELENEGMKIHYTEDTNQISVQKEDTLVIYTPAISSENTELSYFVKNNYIIMKNICTVFGLGNFTKMPGTLGSIAGAFLGFILLSFYPIQLVAVFFIFLLFLFIYILNVFLPQKKVQNFEF